MPVGQLSLFTMFSGNSEENRAKIWLRTGITPRLDVGAGYSHMGKRGSLIFTWHPVRRGEGLPFDLLLGYGFSSSYSREQEGAYVFAVRPFGSLSLVAGVERLRNGRNIGVLAGSLVFSRDSGLMFYLHTATMPGEPTLYNLAWVQRVGAWQVGLWWFHPSQESTVGVSLTTQFDLRR